MGFTIMNDEAAKKVQELRKLAAEAQIVAEATLDPSRKRTLTFLALCHARLAEFVRGKPQISN